MLNRPNNRRPVRPYARPVKPEKSARRVAFDILRDVTGSGAYASLSLDKRLTESRLMGADRRLAAGLVYDTLENMLKLDYALDAFLAKKDTDSALRDLLRLGACQILLYDRVPDSAAVNETVNLCAEIGLEPLKPVVNGVLRNLIRGKDEIKWPSPKDEPAKYLSVMFSLPEWLTQKLILEYGEKQALEIARYRSREGGMTLRPNLTRLTDVQFEALLQRKVWQFQKSAVPHAYDITGAVDISNDRDYTSGQFSIQGASSMLAAMAVDVKNGWQVLDCCAAPGGKSAYLAESMNGTGRVYAWDLHAHRVDLITAMQRRLRLENIRPMMRDALQFREDLEERLDAVLIDAPCSGFGVMLSKPDVKYRHEEKDIAALCKIQADLLDTCCRYVKKGGVLVYSTCTILKEENEEQVKAFLQRHPEFQIDALPNSIPENFRAQAGPYGLQILQHRDKVDGFFICRMKRITA